jgi:hypothetical protein
MKLPPVLFHLRIQPARQRGFGIWLPVILLWPLLLPILLIAIGLALIADIVTGFRFRVTMIIAATCILMCEMRGLQVAVDGRRSGTDVRVSVL